MHRLDSLDKKIIKELASPRFFQWNVRESYASIAKRLGIDEETVRKRIKHAEKIGSIQGWRVVIHPHLIGHEDVEVDLEVTDAEKKPEILSQIKLIEGVIWILNFEGSGLFVLFYSGSGQAISRKVQLIRTICRAEKLTVWSNSLPPCNIKISRTDWSIVWAIRDDPRKSLSEIAKEVGVTTRTVNRRLTLLTESRAFFLVGLANFRQSAGISCNMLIFCPHENDKYFATERIFSRFENTIVFGGSTSSNYLFYNMVFDNLYEANEAYEWIKGLKGVGGVRMRIIRDLIFVRDWLDEEIMRKKRMSENP
jgi:DNA-binding Lrp family transcriptional regulator